MARQKSSVELLLTTATQQITPQERHRTEPRISVRKRRSSHKNVGTSQQRVQSAGVEFSDPTTEKGFTPGEDQITYEFSQQIPETGWKIRHPAVVQRYLAEISSAKSLETCNRHTDTEVWWKVPASYIVIPTDIANVNTQQPDGETGDKPANVVSGEVQPAVEHTVRFSKRQKHC